MGRKPREDTDKVENRIEELRTARGLSRQDLADRTGVHYQTIGYIERGAYSPSLALAIRIAHVLGAEIADVFWIEGTDNVEEV